MSPKEIPDELIDQLLAGHEGPEAITGPDGLLKQLTKRVVERAVSAELSGHLGYELGEQPPEGEPNRRNGWTSKTLITDQGPVPVELPRDREGSFEPQLVPKHQRRFAGFDDKIVSMYARGMSTREISKHLEEIYGVEVGRDTIDCQGRDDECERQQLYVHAVHRFDQNQRYGPVELGWDFAHEHQRAPSASRPLEFWKQEQRVFLVHVYH